MNITDELREYANIATDRDIYAGARLCKIADRIDAEHRAALEKLAAQVDESERSGFDQGFASADDWLAQHEDAMAEHGWIRLPLDADGVPIRVGDELVIFETGEHVRAYDIELYADGRWLVIDEETMDSIHPDRLRHYHTPTVEDVLDEFFGKANLPDGTQTRAEIIAEYAAKLRLAGEDK